MRKQCIICVVPVAMLLFVIIGLLCRFSVAFPVDDNYPELDSDYFEGDIDLGANTRNGIANPDARWDNGVIPLFISPEFNERELKTILAAIEHYHKFTCVRFRYKRPYDEDYVYVQKGGGCLSTIGRQGGKQMMTLGANCFKNVGTLIHEFMHIIGFFHEQARTDRDDYVEINWNNIQENKADNFMKYDDSVVTDLGMPYDYNSIMHYPERAFSFNSTISIKPKDPSARIGQRIALSDIDIRKINKMYESGCNNQEVTEKTRVQYHLNQADAQYPIKFVSVNHKENNKQKQFSIHDYLCSLFPAKLRSKFT